jgi:uncharacterized ParB-like nuclease family protein
MSNAQQIPIKLVKNQPPHQLNQSKISKYTKWLLSGGEAPPIKVYWRGGEYIIRDGYHRLMAYINAGRETIPAVIW